MVSKKNQAQERLAASRGRASRRRGNLGTPAATNRSHAPSRRSSTRIANGAGDDGTTPSTTAPTARGRAQTRGNATTRRGRGRPRGSTRGQSAPASTRITNHNVSANKCPQRFLDAYVDGMKAAARKWGIKNYQESPIFKYERRESSRVGSKKLDGSTQKNYECQMKMLWNWLCMRGKYDSMFMLMDKVPEEAIPIQCEELIYYMKYKRQKPGTFVKDLTDTEVLTDVFGEPIKADGRWDNPKNIYIFNAAMMMIHIENDENGGYHEKCNRCCSSRNCVKHQNQHVRRSGNPMLYKDFLNQKAHYLKKEGYQEMGAAQLLPRDLRDLRDYLLSTRELSGLQMWVEILIACKLFLRHDELYQMTDIDLIKVLHEISEFGIDGLCLQVYGKADTDFIRLMLWADDQFPDLDAVRHLLVYLHCIKWKKGYLFPSEQELHEALQDPSFDGEYKTYCNYETFLDQFKKICLDVLGPPTEDEPHKVGASSFRKTGYLLGVYGGGKLQELMNSARHKSMESAERYFQDAFTQWERHRRNGEARNAVGEWRPIRVESTRNARRTSTDRLKRVEAKDLGSYFVTECLKVQEDHPLFYDWKYLLEKAKDYRQTTSPRERLRELLRSLPVDKVDDITRLIHQVVHEDVSRLVADTTTTPAATGTNNNTNASADQEEATDGATAAAGTTRPAEEGAADERPNKRSKDQEKDDLPRRLKFWKVKDTPGKIKFLLELEPEVPESKSTKLTTNAKTWYYTVMSPILGCYRHHHNIKDTGVGT